MNPKTIPTMIKILIDNGHGIDTAGKCSPDGSLREYKWAREIAARIVAALKAQKYDAELLVPEEKDITLPERVRRVNAWCDRIGKENVIVISIHANAAGADGKWKTAGGWCAYTSPGQTQSDIIATALYKAAEKDLAGYIDRFPIHKSLGNYDAKQRPVRTDYSDGDPDYEARFYILINTKCPAVLTESLFQDNRTDVEFLTSENGKRCLTNLHVHGIINYLTQKTA